MNTVLIFSFLNLWSMGGRKGAPSFQRTVQAYRDAGWKVVLLSTSDSQLVEQELPGVQAVQIRLGGTRLSKIRGLGFFGRMHQTLWGGLCLYFIGQKEAKKAGKPILLYAYEVHAVLPAKLLSLRFKLPLVTRFQGTTLAPVADSVIEKIRLYPHFNALATDSDLIIMTDDGTQGDRVLDRLGNRSPRAFWRNGVDEFNSLSAESSTDSIYESLKIDKSRTLLITVSRLVSWKHIDRSIEATATLIENGYAVSLLIVGDGAERDRLIQLVESKGITSYVHFAGSVPQTEVNQYLEIADVFLSLYDLSNLGNPLFEAMTCAKPIVTLDVGDTSRVIVDNINGVLLDQHDNQTVTEGILRVLNDSAYASQLGKNAKQFASENFWSWQHRMDMEIERVQVLMKSK
ncbi:glycosyltransferase family 4 protein [Glutamicibacter bergerei]